MTRTYYANLELSGQDLTGRANDPTGGGGAEVDFTSLYLEFNNPDSDPTVNDSSTNTFIVTNNGTLLAHSNLQAISALTSLRANNLNLNTVDYLSISGSNQLKFGNEDFTIEFWVRWATAPNATEISPVFYSYRDLIDTDFAFFYFNGELVVFVNNAPIFAGFTFTPAINTWYHIALVRINLDFSCYVDGLALTLPVTVPATINDNGFDITILGDTFNQITFDGFIDEMRIVKGAAVYDADFTVPTPPLGLYTETIETGGTGFTGFVEVSGDRDIEDDDLGKLLKCDTTGGAILLNLDHTALTTPDNFNLLAVNLTSTALRFQSTTGTISGEGNEVTTPNILINIFHNTAGEWWIFARSLSVFFGGAFPTAGLVNYWRMDEVSGTRTDAQLNNDLSEVGTIASTTGINNLCIQKSGSNTDYLDSATWQVPAGDFSIVLWLQANNLTAISTYFSAWATGDKSIQINYNNTPDAFEVEISFNGIATATLTDTAVTGIGISTWYNIIVIYDSNNVGSELQIIVNNQTPTTASSPPINQSAGGLRISQSNDTPNNPMTGFVDEVAVFNRVLTPIEIGSIYNSGAGSFLP